MENIETIFNNNNNNKKKTTFPGCINRPENGTQTHFICNLVSIHFCVCAFFFSYLNIPHILIRNSDFHPTDTRSCACTHDTRFNLRLMERKIRQHCVDYISNCNELNKMNKKKFIEVELCMDFCILSPLAEYSFLP